MPMRPRSLRHDGVGGVVGVGEGAEAGRQLGDAVAVGHPDGDAMAAGLVRA